MARIRQIRPRKRFQRSRFGMGARGAKNPKQRVAGLRRAQTRRLKGR